jgi:hypothetical protein
LFRDVKFEAANMKISSFFPLMMALAFLPAGHAADITGTITFTGTPPAENRRQRPRSRPGSKRLRLHAYYSRGANRPENHR